MTAIKIDNDILQMETTMFLKAIAQYREAVKVGALLRMSREFQLQIAAVDAVIDEFERSLRPIGTMSIITIINENLMDMFLRPKDETDFGVERGNDHYARFFDLAEKQYVHEPATGFLAKEDGAKAAKQVLHDYLDCAFLFHNAIRKQMGMVVDATILKTFVERGHGFIDLPQTAERGQVMPLSFGRKIP